MADGDYFPGRSPNTQVATGTRRGCEFIAKTRCRRRLLSPIAGRKRRESATGVASYNKFTVSERGNEGNQACGGTGSGSLPFFYHENTKGRKHETGAEGQEPPAAFRDFVLSIFRD